MDIDLTRPVRPTTAPDNLRVVHAPASILPSALGARVRRLRLERSWTLANASRCMGLSLSALSKIERGELSPTLSSLSKIASGFGIDVASLVKDDSLAAVGRRSVTRAHAGDLLATATCRNTWLAADLRQKRMLPIHTLVTARSPDDYGEWEMHEGEVFVYVLSGTMVVHSKIYAPIELYAGDSLYYDAEVGTKWTSEGLQDAAVLWVYA